MCSHFPCALSWVIEEAQRRDPTALAGYTHSFIVVAPDGTTLDTTETVHYGNLYTDYSGTQVLVGRINNLDPSVAQAVLKVLAADLGKLYPVQRLFLDALDLGRVIQEHAEVCSERAVMAVNLTGKIPDMSDPSGWEPGEMAMAIRHWREFEVVWEGVVT